MKKKSSKKRRKQHQQKVSKPQKVLSEAEVLKRATFHQAKNVVQGLNWASYLSIALLILFRNQLEYVLWLPVALPIVAAMIFIYFKDAVYFSGNDDDDDMKVNKGKVDIRQAFAIPMLALLFTALLSDFDTIRDIVWGYVIAGVLIWSMLLAWSNNGFKFKEDNGHVHIFYFFICFMFYTPSTTVLLNYVYDLSEPKTDWVEVYDKEIEKDGSRTKYLLELAPWARKPHSTEEYVGRDIYEGVKIGGKVKIKSGDGLFGMPWMLIE